MAALLTRLHHISLNVSNAEKVASDLVSKFKFSLFATRLTDGSRQLAFRKGAAVFIVNERPTRSGAGMNETLHITHSRPRVPQLVDVGKHNRGDSAKCLYDVSSRYPVDTVNNVCFEVEDVERSSRALSHLGCSFMVPPTTVHDECGHVTYSVVKSIVGNVCHTLIDRTKYKGSFLPGFDGVENDMPDTDASCPITHFDHITYVCLKKTTSQVMRWYEKLFGFQRFFIDSAENVDEGFVINQEGIGLRLTAMEYWKCSESGIALPSVDKKEPDCKFVIAESLSEQGSRNQVDTFLEQHGAPGIQHIGLYTTNIVSTAHAMADAGVQFFSPPRAYYMQVGKQQEMEEAGLNPQMLAKHGILLDTDLNRDPSSSQTASGENRGYLLQVFTKPLFAEDTFFLELIERRGATGFGEGNIRALWRSVQAHMENQGGDSQGEESPKMVQTSQY
ncbi:4-hydroxyphenylpyruvate dioxygenase-like protein [Cebidichthys violaceus]|uniref:4-hydroxyphenylpyruvate dioxygenase-like protein n=1 Tax=Cebidichthys violaceus TaxID=271503 RepID=UPI0035CAEE2A